MYAKLSPPMSNPYLNNAPGKLMDSAFTASVPFEGVDLSKNALLSRLRDLLQQKVHGLCFSAYLPGQSPGDHSELSPAQVRARLEIIAPHTQWIRTFSCTEGNQHAAAIAKDLGIKTLVGAWLGTERDRNEEEINATIEVAKAGHADLVAVGNEVLLREDLPEEELIDYIRRVKAALPHTPVAYVDAYYLFAQRPRLVDACDFLPINCYPFWEKCPLEQSFGYVQEMVRRVQAVAHGKPVLIAETGWPTEGTPEGDATPGLDHAARYAINLIPWAEKASIPLFWFAAFDEAWKVGAEGDCGAFWGFWDAEGDSKLV